MFEQGPAGLVELVGSMVTLFTFIAMVATISSNSKIAKLKEEITHARWEDEKAMRKYVEEALKPARELEREIANILGHLRLNRLGNQRRP